VPKIQLLEVVSGFGLGGAEKSLSARLPHIPDAFELSVLNVRPEIDAFRPKVYFNESKISGRNFKRMIEVSRFLRSNHFDVVIVRTPLDAIRFAVLKFLVGKYQYKLIFEAHSNFVSKKFGVDLIFGVLLRFISRSVNLVIAVSNNVSRGPLCKGQKNVRTVYLGANLDLSTLAQEAPSRPRLVFVGRMVDLKRPLWLLERVHKISTEITLPQPALMMVGTGPLESEVKKLISDKNMEKLVDFVGAQEYVSDYYAMATHLVSCSTNEGLPLTFFEAKLAGLSILATPSGGGSEIFKEEDLELSSFEEQEFEAALLQIFKSPPPNAKARAAIQEKSSWMSAQEGSKRYYAEVFRLLAE